MKRILIIFFICFLFGSCSSSKKCDGSNKAKSEMW